VKRDGSKQQKEYFKKIGGTEKEDALKKLMSTLFGVDRYFFPFSSIFSKTSP
jgi:hypothetical protein